MAKNKKFWIGGGTLAGIKYGEEIPVGKISDDRIREFEEKGLIGEVPKVVEKVSDDSKKIIKELKSEIEKLKSENKELKEKSKSKLHRVGYVDPDSESVIPED